ncbi:ATP-dependent DNA helicase Rep, partial [Acidithiobacillus sp. GGI-221]
MAELNPPQQEAVTHIHGPLLVLAGAGRARPGSSPGNRP